MIFEKNSLCVVETLDSTEGARYTKPMHDDESDNEMDFIYQLTMKDEDQFNPTANGRISQECDSSCTMN